ncbi:hypothetical protein GCM10010837_46930 [Aminobacter niigataensis]
MNALSRLTHFGFKGRHTRLDAIEHCRIMVAGAFQQCNSRLGFDISDKKAYHALIPFQRDLKPCRLASFDQNLWESIEADLVRLQIVKDRDGDRTSNSAARYLERLIVRQFSIPFLRFVLTAWHTGQIDNRIVRSGRDV